MKRSYIFVCMGIAISTVLGCSDGDPMPTTSSSSSSSSGDGGMGGEGGMGGNGGDGGGTVDLCAGVVCAAEACMVAGTCDPATGKCSDATVAPDGSDCECGTCAQGACGPRFLGLTSEGQGSPTSTSLAIDADKLYATNLFSGIAGKGTVEWLPKSGGTMPTVLVSGLTSAAGISRDGNKLFYIDEATGLWSVMTDGNGSPTQLIMKAGNGFRKTAIAGGMVYVTDNFANSILAVPVGGGASTTFATGQAGVFDIVADGTNVYWTNLTEKAIKQMPMAGGAIVTLASNLSQVGGIAVDATHLYFVDAMEGTVNKVPIGGGAITILASGQDRPNVVTVAGDTVYWANAANGTIGTMAKAPIAGGASTPVPGSVGLPTAITHDGSCLYWVSRTTGAHSAPL